MSTAIVAGGFSLNHSEGIVVSTAIRAGGPEFNHAEGIVVSTPISAGGVQFQHAEGIVVSTAITAGPGSNSGGVWLNHVETLSDGRATRTGAIVAR